MRKPVKNNVSWVGYIDWELESFHGDDYSIMNGSSQTPRKTASLPVQSGRMCPRIMSARSAA